ncbi:MAG: hypothetical protein EB127_25455 [Alphaproteobacteria bacterium]|nr:hypothetical protein [Alphaproteobacteria bacterium]
MTGKFADKKPKEDKVHPQGESPKPVKPVNKASFNVAASIRNAIGLFKNRALADSSQSYSSSRTPNGLGGGPRS